MPGEVESGGAPRSRRFLFALILLAALVLRLPSFSDPFLRPHEDDNARYGLAARNHLRLGLAVTRGSNCLAVATDEPRPGDFYVNHPGTLSLILAAAYAVLGESEAATRLVPLLFSLAGLALLHRAARHRLPPGHAALVTACAAFFPIAAWYGKLATFMPLILPVGVAVADSVVRSVEEEREAQAPFGSALEVGGMAFAAAVDYGGMLLLPALVLAVGFRRRLLGPAAAAAGVAALCFAQVAWIAGPGGVAALFAKGLARAGAGTELSWTAFLSTQALYFAWNAFTPIGAGLAVAGLFLAFRRRGPESRLVLALGLWGLLYILVFREAATVHDYWQFYLIPAVAFLCAAALTRLPRALALVLLLLFLDQSVRVLNRRYYSDTGWYAREHAAAAFAREHAKDRDVVLTREPLRSVVAAYYADRRFVDAPMLESDFAVR